MSKLAKSLFDIMGPIMIGPSSSHTAGAARIGLIAKNIFGSIPNKITFKLYNSFAKTGKGHGTDKALLGGTLGLQVDNKLIKKAHLLARLKKIDYSFEYLTNNLKHPNSVEIILEDQNKGIKIEGISVGAGDILIEKINDFNFNIDGKKDSILLIYKDKPGMIYKFSALFNSANINIATMNCDRSAKGQEASIGITIDDTLPDMVLEKLNTIEDVYLIRHIKAIK